MPQPGRGDRPPLYFYLDRFDVGGVERIVLNLLTGLRQRGWATHLVLNQASGTLLPALSASVPLTGLGVRRFASAAPALARFLRERPSGILLSQRAYLNAIALLAARLAGSTTPVVVAEHSLLSRWQRDPHAPKRAIDHLLPLVLPRLYRQAAAVVGISAGVRQDLATLLGWPTEWIRLLYNPILSGDEAERARETDELPAIARPYLVAIGRLSPEKGLDLLLEAFARIAPELDLDLALVGDGLEGGRLRALARGLGVAERVHFVGARPNPFPLLARARALVLPSRLESFPTVLIEAMALGIPVVAADCPCGPREIVTAGRDGWLVAPGDPVALAHGIRRVVEDPSLARALAMAGRERAQAFTIERGLTGYEALFLDLARWDPRRRNFPPVRTCREGRVVATIPTEQAM